MTSSELNYLIKLDLLRKDNEIVRMTMLAKEAGVSKPSMLQALEKFEKMNILKKDDKNILFTEEGKKMFDDYKLLVDYIANHFIAHCHTKEEQALDDAINAVCAVSDECRKDLQILLSKWLENSFYIFMS